MKIPPQCTGVKRLLDKKRSVSDPYKRESLKRDIIVETCLSKPNANLLLNQSPSTLTFKDFYVDQVNQIDTSKALPTIVVKDLEPEKAKNEEIHNHLLPQYSQQEKHDEKHLSLTVSEPSLNKPALISQSVPGSRVKVLYDYYGTNSEEVTIYEGEDVIIIKLGRYDLIYELDDGTGWTTIMKTGTIGVVPTTYIAIDFPKDIVQSNTTLNETQLEMKRKSNKGVWYSKLTLDNTLCICTKWKRRAKCKCW
ncbi:hypothetical protein BC833DRAFT_156556 [Globomyces pollinis-pini]|nr:hypothetical protein BC833DRAFT_156556 [Globomyces pollinis-pini]